MTLVNTFHFDHRTCMRSDTAIMCLILSQDTHPDMEEEIFCFDIGIDEDALIDLSLDEAKQVLTSSVARSVCKPSYQIFARLSTSPTPASRIWG